MEQIMYRDEVIQAPDGTWGVLKTVSERTTKKIMDEIKVALVSDGEVKG